MTTFNPFTLEGKTILVTGASSGIGRGIAIACSKMGATVIINGRNEQRLAETMTEMQGEENLSLAADLSDSNSLTGMVSRLPKLDGIVHCAGIGQRVLCKQLQEADLDTMMDVNFKAPVMLQTEILKQKKINKGASIVFIASIASDSPSIGNAVVGIPKRF
jgi:NADP-dependent 3-hydroxy acid dehydrogenase YdfG